MLTALKALYFFWSCFAGWHLNFISVDILVGVWVFRCLLRYEALHPFEHTTSMCCFFVRVAFDAHEYHSICDFVFLFRVLVVPFAPCGLICNSLQDSSSPAFLGCGCAVHKSKSAFICKCGSRFCVVDASFLDELCWVVHASVGCLGRQWNWLLVAQRQIWWVVWQDHRHVFHWHLVPEPSI